MNSEEILQQNLPIVESILDVHNINRGKYSVSAFVKDEGNSGCIVSPTDGNNNLFTNSIQLELTNAGFEVQIKN